MTDQFALLGEVRRPWIDPEELKSRVLALSAQVHPDRFPDADADAKEAANQRAAEINAAHAVLRDAKARLLHLLELELGRRPVGIEQAPPGLLDLFLQVGQLCQEADRFQAERERLTSPMLRVKAFEKELDITTRIHQTQGELRETLTGMETELRDLNRAWELAPAPGSPERAGSLPLNRLEEIARACSFADRWLSQLQERLVQMAV